MAVLASADRTQAFAGSEAYHSKDGEEKVMSIVVPDEILTATRMNEAEMRQEIAVMLFQREKLTLAQASRFAGMHRVAFQHLLASRHISVHYGTEDFEQDIQTLREMGRL